MRYYKGFYKFLMISCRRKHVRYSHKNGIAASNWRQKTACKIASLFAIIVELKENRLNCPQKNGIARPKMVSLGIEYGINFKNKNTNLLDLVQMT